jgi:hypothetical protein
MTETAAPHSLIVVAPEVAVQAMIKRGFKSTDRANGFTVTMCQWFLSEDEAMAEGRKLKGYIWGVERAR